MYEKHTKTSESFLRLANYIMNLSLMYHQANSGDKNARLNPQITRIIS